MQAMNDIWDEIIDVKMLERTPVLISITKELSEQFEREIPLNGVSYVDVNTLFGIPLEVDDTKVHDPRGFAVWYRYS